MVKNVSKKAKKESSSNKANKKTKKKTTSEIKLNEKYYKELCSEEIYSEETRVGKIFGTQKKDTGERFIQLKGKSKMPWGWQHNLGFSIRRPNYLDKLIISLKKIAARIGWKLNDPTPKNIQKIKEQIGEQQKMILDLERANEEVRANFELSIKELLKKQKQILEENSQDYLIKIRELGEKIADVKNKEIPEADLQKFLYENPWMFGAEYISSEPQKLRGAHSIFDFYLERYNKTKDIVEIKLLSDNIINRDNSICAKVIQAVDQLIGYMESSQAAAHSTVISEEEEIKELRPRGIIIIGKDNSPKAITKLRQWNYQFAHIKILTYQDILNKANALAKHLEMNSSS